MFPSIFGPQVIPKSKGSGSAFTVYEHNYFGGAWTYPDRAQVDQRGALSCTNMRFINRQTGTRYGLGPVVTIADSVNDDTAVGMFNWVSELGNYLVFCRLVTSVSNALFLTNISTNPSPLTTVVSLSPTSSPISSPVFAPAGPRLYMAQWGTGVGFGSASTISTAGPTYVISNSGTFNADKIIPGPPTNTQVPNGTFTEPGTGIMTAGTHSFGVRMLHRSGFLGRPGPDSSTTANPTPQTFIPWSFTSAGGKNLQWTFTPTSNWPADVVQVQLMMNTVADPTRYFLVPGQVQNVTGGAMTPVTFTANIDDGSLVAAAVTLECTDSLNFYTASATGQAYMQCAGVWNIGNRMFYLSQLPDPNGNNYWVVFASDPYQYQQISLSQHLIQLPNQLQIAGIFSYQGSIYLGGPRWTYYTQDNGQKPINWMQPQLVDGTKGISAPNCVEIASSGQYAWIADKTGLYFFQGSYPSTPISYNQNDIWLVQSFPNGLISLRDDPVGRRVIMSFGGSTVLSWDVTSGFDTFSSRFSSYNYNGGLTAIDSLTLVQNTLASQFSSGLSLPEIWTITSDLASPSNYYVQREKNPSHDTNVYRDEGSQVGAKPIATLYKPPIFPVPAGEYDYLTHIGCKIRAVGAGVLTVGVFPFDGFSGGITLNPSVNLTSATPGKQELRGYLLSNNGFVYQFSQSALDSNFILDEIDMYYAQYGSFL